MEIKKHRKYISLDFNNFNCQISKFKKDYKEQRNKREKGSSMKDFMHIKIQKTTDSSVKDLENKSTDRITLKETILLYVKCLICDKNVHKDYVFCLKCDHKFCYRCSKHFYEKKIDDRVRRLKCPVHKCLEFLSRDNLYHVISNVHYDTYVSYDNETLKFDSETQVEPLSSNRTLHRAYTEKHILTFASTNSHLDLDKVKQTFCIFCKEPSLYTRTYRNYYKCLNCFKTICKYCQKPYTMNHLVYQKEKNWCRVYFKRLNSNIDFRKATISLVKKFLYECLFIIASYFLTLIWVYIQISNKNKFLFKNLKIIRIIIYIIATLIIIPVYTIILPFYPMSLCVLDKIIK